MLPAGEGNKIGDTTNDYAAVVSLDARTSSQIGIAIKNTGLVNNMLLKITSKLNFNGLIEFTELEDYVLAPGAIVRYNELKPVSKIIVYVKSEIAETPTSWSIENIVRYV